MGIQCPSKSTARWRACGPAPPIRMGGYGFCTGLGYDHSFSKLTYLPWNSASSWVQMALRAPMRSRRIFHRSAKGVPWCSISSAFHPPPMPKSTRPLREVIEARYLLGEKDRVALDDEADTGPELERLGHHSRRAQGYEGIEGVPVLARQVGSAGPRALAAGRDVRVLGEPHGLERARF